MTLRRAGWKTHHLDYWNWFEDGWIEDDAAAANDLREFIRRFFAIENEEEFNVRNANDQKLIDQDKKDLSSEETNFLLNDHGMFQFLQFYLNYLHPQH